VDYLSRIVDGELDELMSSLPAIVLDGPRAVGKTETARRRAGEVFELDDPAQLEVVAADPGSLVSSISGTILFDEWQRHPPLWDFVRRQSERDAPAGRFLLTGSAIPTTQPVHPGSGRLVELRMRPMSLAERQIETPVIGLGEMLTGNGRAIAGASAVTLSGYLNEILASGFPGIRPLEGRARRAQLDGYISRVIDRDFPELGLTVRRPATLRAWLAAYAAATSTTTTYNKLLGAATSGEAEKPAKTTTIAYRDVLERLYLVDPVPGWLPTQNRLSRLTQAPKHHLADPALAAHLVGIDAGALLRGDGPAQLTVRDGSFLGALFESLVTLSVRVYAQANEATVHHLRTRDGDHEVDLIVARRDDSVVALEVKLTAAVDDSDVRHLLWLREQLGDDLLDAAVITAGDHAYRRPDGIAVIPAALLGS
jgi:predicted AAA+ superfamily ATPase